MGQESLGIISIEKYYAEWDKGLREELDKQYLKDHFMLGEEADKNKIDFYSLYLKVFCNDSCELSEWIWKKINGFFEDPSVNLNGEVKSLKYQPVQYITNIYNQPTDWKSIDW